jgi:hypothetical protein
VAEHLKDERPPAAAVRSTSFISGAGFEPATLRGALHPLFVLAALTSAVAFVLTLALREIPLRDQTHLEAEGGIATTAAEAVA